MEGVHRISMKLKCKIHEQDYDIVSGATFSEEYNETLDSGSIILDHIPRIKDLKPYDDVYIWNADDEFKGYCNVGDKVSSAELGGSITTRCWSKAFGNLSYMTITDDNFTNLFPMTASANQFYFPANRIDMNFNSENIFFPGLIDIWASNFLYNLEHNNPNCRWEVPRIALRITLHNDYHTYTADYYLPEHKETGITENGMLILTKVGSGGSAPQKLYVNFSLKEPFIYGATVMLDMRLRLDEIAVADVGEEQPTENDIYTIQRLEKPNNVSSYSYKYFLDAGTRLLPRIDFSIEGLTKAQILGLRDIKINFNAQGYDFYDFVCPKPIWNETEQKILLEFKPLIFYGNFFHNEDGCSIELSQDSNGNWSCIGQQFYLTFGSTIYPIDKIINDVNDNLYVHFYNSSVIDEMLPSFFKHLLVDKFTAEMVDLDKSNYKYKISLMSETKGLEKKILPNISITQPIVGTKRTIYYYLKQYIDFYSPKIKKLVSNNKWEYVNKYQLDARDPSDIDQNDKYIGTPVSAIFADDIFAPEMSLTQPSLREILSRLMIVKDCIPVVKNNVIYAMNIGNAKETHGEFLIDGNHINFVFESMDSENYSTAFRRKYEGAISQKNSTHCVEFIGFRNSSSALLTLENMRLETRLPIYKINSVIMHYYKLITIMNDQGEFYKKLVLVKQDITPLILQNTVRNTLSADWTNYQSEITFASMEQLANYKILTLGYDIGSNLITGWGEKYTYIADLLGWFHGTDTYIENIMDIIDGFSHFGFQNENFLDYDEAVAGDYGWRATIVSPSGGALEDREEIDNIALKLKTLFFKIDYVGMYSGTIVHSKDETENDDLETPDNCSSALSILEVDGLFEKEKANRLANATVSFSGRYDSYEQMNDEYNNVLGATFNLEENEESENDDIVVYHREYQIYDDCVLCNFVGSYDYVLKNYFTTVFAKYRTYSYAGYNENVDRAENDKYSVVLSTDKLYFESESAIELLNGDEILSAFNFTTISNLNFVFNDQVNGAYLTFYKKLETGTQTLEYFSDVSQFVSGYSLCFNVKTFSNLTSGVFISAIDCFSADNHEYTNYVGSAQDWYMMPLNSKTDGFLETIGFYFGHFDEKSIVQNNIKYGNDETVDANDVFKDLLALPKKNRKAVYYFGKTYNLFKDNKETIDFTLQYELINANKNDIIVSEWLMKLTDFSNYIKISTDKEIMDFSLANVKFRIFYSTKEKNNWDFWDFVLGTGGSFGWRTAQVIVLRVKDEDVPLFQNPTTKMTGCNNFSYAHTRSSSTVDRFHYNRTYINFLSLQSVESNGDLNVLVEYQVYFAVIDDPEDVRDNSRGIPQVTKQKVLKFTKLSNVGEQGFTDYYYIGQDIPNPNTSSLGDNDELMYHSSNSKYVPSGNDFNSQLSLSNSEIVSGTMEYSSAPLKTYHPTMFVFLSTEKLKGQLVYEQYTMENLPNKYTVLEFNENLNFENIFKVVNDGKKTYIHYKSPTGYHGYQSVQYWYYDREENGGDGYLHFVFGVNVDDTVQEKKIYISTLKSRNPKVYDYMHREVGTVMNFAEPENADKYGEQLFVPYDNDEEEE